MMRFLLGVCMYRIMYEFKLLVISNVILIKISNIIHLQSRSEVGVNGRALYELHLFIFLMKFVMNFGCF